MGTASSPSQTMLNAIFRRGKDNKNARETEET